MTADLALLEAKLDQILVRLNKLELIEANLMDLLILQRRAYSTAPLTTELDEPKKRPPDSKKRIFSDWQRCTRKNILKFIEDSTQRRGLRA